MSLDLDALEEALNPPPNDFRRVGRGVPMVMVDGKWQRFSRSSNAGKVLDDENALTDWRLRTMLVGAAYRPELLAQVSTLDVDLDKKRLRDIAEECLIAGKGRARQVTGTAIHSMLDHIDLEHDWQPTPDYALVCQAYAQTCANYGLIVVDVECPCINVPERLAGTMDRRYRTTRVLIAPDGSQIPIGTILASDTKTGRTLEYNNGTYSTQLAAYVDSLRYDVKANTFEPFEPPTFKEWALVMHVLVESATCEPYWVDLQAGRQGLRLSREVKAWRKRTDLLLPAKAPSWPVGLPSHPTDQPAAIAHEEPLQASQSDAEGLDAYRWLRERVGAIKRHDDATRMLLREWPEATPGLKEYDHTRAQLIAIEHVLDKVETEYSLPFPSMRPQRPRQALIDGWLERAHTSEATTLGQALVAFGSIDAAYTDLELSELLDATLRGLEYPDGMAALKTLPVDDVEYIRHAAGIIMQETHVLRYVNGKPVLLERTLPNA